MKSYTDLEQSKKLAEFLPLESADMYYQYVLPKSDKINHVPEIGNPKEALEWYNKGYTHFGKEPLSLKEYCIPCWSLAALLNILHSKAKDIPNLSGGGYKDGEYISDWCLDYEFENGDYQKTFADNPLDACVAMIEKLYELKIL